MISLEYTQKGEIPGDATPSRLLVWHAYSPDFNLHHYKKIIFNLIKFQNKWGKFGNRHRHTQKTVGETEKNAIYCYYMR